MADQPRINHHTASDMGKVNTGCLLGLDLATLSGFAVVAIGNGEVLESGTIDASIRVRATKTIPADHLGKRMQILADRLRELFQKYNIEHVSYEAIAQGRAAGGRTAAVARWLECVAILVAYEHVVEITSYAAGTIKKHATGDGSWRTKKEQMIAAAVERWPDLDIDDDNEADALWVADLGISNL